MGVRPTRRLSRQTGQARSCRSSGIIACLRPIIRCRDDEGVFNDEQRRISPESALPPSGYHLRRATLAYISASCGPTVPQSHRPANSRALAPSAALRESLSSSAVISAANA